MLDGPNLSFAEAHKALESYCKPDIVEVEL